MTLQVKPGDRAWRWFDAGAASGAGQVVFTVVRVNRTTVTVRNGFDELVRIPRDDLEGIYTEDG